MAAIRDERVRQVTVGVMILAVIAMITVTLHVFGRTLPGLLGEWVAIMVGFMSTPVFLEIVFATLGLMIVLALNHWRQRKDGEEFIYLEQVEDRGAPEDLPKQPKWSISREEPLPTADPALLPQAKGAFSSGDHEAAAEFIAQMNRDELIELEVLQLRRDLAEASGRHELARHLEIEIRSVTREDMNA